MRCLRVRASGSSEIICVSSCIAKTSCPGSLSKHCCSKQIFIILFVIDLPTMFNSVDRLSTNWHAIAFLELEVDTRSIISNIGAFPVVAAHVVSSGVTQLMQHRVNKACSVSWLHTR